MNNWKKLFESSLHKGNITDMYCSCPYADGGYHCKLAEDADTSVVKEYLVSALAENEKLLIRFHNIVRKPFAKEGVERYIRQVDAIVRRYLGREQFISYYAVGNFISELYGVLEEDVRRMMDKRQYSSAFELMNHIFVLIGDVAMDDSDGGTGMLSEQIYQLWLELLTKVNAEEKQGMFDWFTSHLDGSVIDYLEEYIEQIIMEEFKEKEFVQQKLLFAEEMIKEAEKMDSDWSGSYKTGKWALAYLSLLELQKCDKSEIESFCRKHCKNSDVRSYYIDRCVKAKEYEAALKALDESMSLDRGYAGLIADYSRKKKEIYLLKGDKAAYVNQLWELVLKHEAGVLKKDYPEQILKKYKEEVSKMAGYAGGRQIYREIVSLLRKMKKVKGGAQMVDAVAAD